MSTRLARGAAVVAMLITAAACTSATAHTSAASSSSPGSGGNATRGRGLTVSTAGGTVRGKAVAATDEFLGIPYAAPPVGALRWQPPRPAAPWSGVRAATSFAPHCPQPSSSFGVASSSEDCLYLNVFTPAGVRARNLPVMVWVHGGSLRTGAGDEYNPTGLVGHGVVVVTINYRLGALGFLADAEFNDENAPELFLPPVSFPYGAAHASELQYPFSQVAVPHPADLTAAQQQLTEAMKRDWTTMAKTGVPAAGWPRFSPASQRMLSLVPPRPQTETSFSAQHQCAFWIPAEASR